MIVTNPTSSALQLRLLIVDDDIGLLDAMKRSLRESVQTVVACDSFERARQTLKDQPFDALITDVRLGAFNGLQLAVMARDMYPKHATDRLLGVRRSGAEGGRGTDRRHVPRQAGRER